MRAGSKRTIATMQYTVFPLFCTCSVLTIMIYSFIFVNLNSTICPKKIPKGFTEYIETTSSRIQNWLIINPGAISKHARERERERERALSKNNPVLAICQSVEM